MALHAARATANEATGRLEVEVCPAWSNGACGCLPDAPGHALYHFPIVPADPVLRDGVMDRKGRRQVTPPLTAEEWARRCVGEALALEGARLGVA